jgi:predicted ATPase/DNA-binding SARP family transcriptional activator
LTADRKPHEDDEIVLPARLGVLGAVTFERRGERLSLGGPKAQQVVAVLVAHHRRSVSSDLLIDTLWDGEPPPSAAGTLQSHISRLRGVLEPEIVITREPDGYRLDAPPSAVDAERFEHLVDGCADQAAADVVRRLDEALRLWRGPAFGTHADLDPVRPEAVRLEELRLVAWERWAAARLELGDAAAVVGDLESIVDRHPFRERFCVLLMLALHRAGRTAEALRRGNELRTRLRDETGLDVSAAVREAEALILGDEQARPSAVSSPAGSVRGSKLLGSTSFVGREPEVAEIVRSLQHHAVVTVTGPGGVGKTRLALRCAAQVAEETARDVIVVEFATLRDPDGVVPLIAHGLDIQQRQYRTLDETIVEYLTPRRDLLVLDNCEHLTDVIAPLVDRVRSACPDLRMLATSREPLGLAGERVAVIAPLALPSRESVTLADIRDSPAVELFVSRAQISVPEFELREDNAHSVAEICRRLDGLPLGLELAAARLRSLGVQTLADRLAQRVQSLGQRQRSGDGRHHTLLDLVRWSYDLLDPHARSIFAQLAVFAGGFELDAVDAVCRARDGDRARDTVEALSDLVEKSMVVVVDRDVPRYRQLEPLREFALDRLVEDGSLDEVEDRHLEWFVGLAERGAIGIDTRDEARWSARLDGNLDNFRAAFQFAARIGDADRALRLVAALRELSFRRVKYEVTTWAGTAAAIPGADEHPAYATALAMDGYGHWVRGDLDAAIRLARAALDIEAADTSTSGLPERVLGNAIFYLGEPAEALQWMHQMLQSARNARDPARLAHALYMQSVAQTSLGDTVRGAVLAGEARAAADAAGSATALSQASYALGLALEGTDQEEALGHLDAAARLAASAGNRWVETFALTEVHWLRARRGEHAAALAGFGDIVKTWHRGGDWANQWLSLRRLFGVLVDIGALEAGTVLYGALKAAGAAHALPFEPADAERLDGIVDDLRSLLGSASFEEAVRRGASMTDSEIVEYVIEQIDDLRGNSPLPAAPGGSPST